MFKTISRLFFGAEEPSPEDVKPGEAVEEGWLVVSHEEADSAENPAAEPTETQTPNTALQRDAAASEGTDISASDPEPTDQSSRDAVAASQPEALVEVTPLTCNQKAKTWADRHHVTRNAIQRQNRLRQGVQQHCFHLHQPGLRHLGH